MKRDRTSLRCLLGNHDWRLSSVQSRQSGYAGSRIILVTSVYGCWRCAAQRTR